MSYRAQVEPRAQIVPVNGLAHRVLHWGPPSADPIVLLHGFQDAADTYQFLVDALPRDWSFAAPDWRGFGGSAAAGRPYWFPEYYADLEQLLDHLVPGRPARIVAHSMGGNVATHYAGIRPPRVGWLVSLEGFGLPRTSPEQAPDRYARWLDALREPLEPRRYESVAQLALVLARRNPRLSAEVAGFVARAWSRPAPGSAPGGAIELAHDPWHRLVNPVLSRREESEACWRRVAAPVLFLLAEHSEYLPRLGSDGSHDYLRQHFARATVVTLGGVGHMLHHEDPAAVADASVRWVGTLGR
jgi:pimeloyl-ACP methyl ester carboxylesterase